MKVILIILDGWGITNPSYGNAINSANTPTFDMLEASYPSMPLQASGIAVGLPWGEEGNSEVGHLSLGAGRIVMQYLPRIISDIRSGAFFENKAFKKAAFHVKKNNSSLHLIGLVSSGSAHSYIDHLYSLLDFAKREGISSVYIHFFTDGKDSPPKEAAKFIEQLTQRLDSKNLGSISTIIGRVYAMDRNGDWEATQKTYELLTEGKGKVINDPVEYLKNSYEKTINDQYIEPAIVTQHETPASPSERGEHNTKQTIQAGDAVVFFNFREDSARQLAKAFTEDKFDHFPRKKIDNLFFVAMTQYYQAIPLSNVAFRPPDIVNPLAQILSLHEKKQLHITESQKYAHVTYFFNGFIEKPFPGEERILIPSYATSHYEGYPEMGALKITDKIIENINSFDFILTNFANADMLAHTGNIQAAKKGIEVLDGCVKRIIEAQDDNTVILITADHGNAEEMLNPKTGAIKTEHTSNPVPFYFVHKQKKGRYTHPMLNQQTKGMLGDVAPTILELMNLPVPPEMTGQSLLSILRNKNNA